MTAIDWGTPEPVGTTGALPATGAVEAARLLIEPAQFLRAIRLAEHARARDEARPVLTWFHFVPAEPPDEGYVLETADNYRVARVKLPTVEGSSGAARFLIPGGYIQLMVKALRVLPRTALTGWALTLRADTVTETWTFEVPLLGMAFTGRLGDATFPNVQTVFGHHPVEHEVALNAAYLAQACKAMADAGEHTVVLTMGDPLKPVRLRTETIEEIVMPIRTPQTERPS